jgi:hypothetical protein
MKSRYILVSFIVLVAVSACSALQLQNAETKVNTALNQAATTAAGAGQLFCGVATQTGPLVVGLLDAAASIAGQPAIVSVINKSAAWVASACATWNAAAVPVVPPANPAMVPAVAVTLPAG